MEGTIKMITMINERNGHKTRFKNYKRLYSHINSHQWVRRYNTPNHLIDDWFFASHSHRRVMAFYEFASAQKDAEKTSGGKPQKFDVLEMSHDLSTKPIIMPITPDLDVESLLEDWCKRCCAFHGYKLVEVQDDGGILHVKRTQHHPSLEC
jgi:hypothetical protein